MLRVHARPLGGKGRPDERGGKKNGTGPGALVRRLWAKDSSLWKSEPAHRKIISNSLGWLDMPRLMPGRLAELDAFAEEVRAGGIAHVVVLGMGGSSLAPEVFRRSVPRRKGYPALHVLDSTDPEAVAALEAAAPPERSLYLLASKSGSTVEPNRMLDYFYAKSGPRPGERFVAITDPDSPLTRTAAELSFRKIFLNYADIGGRYSALSLFGLLPAALAGIDIRSALDRAARMAEACGAEPENNPGWRLGQELAEHARRGRDKLTVLAAPEIESLGLWLEQLIAESTGKEGLGVVPISGEAELAPGDYGADRVFVGLRLNSSASDFALAARLDALERSGHPLIRIELADTLDLGAEFFRWEFATAVLGRALGINPFDQPNVQSAKDRTVALLARLEETGGLPEPERHAAEGGLSLTLSRRSTQAGGGTLDEILARLCADTKPGDYAGLLVYLDAGGRYDAAFDRLRECLGAASGLPVQAGYGPRYLHSTGQLHKGGANNGVFLVVSREDGLDLKIPGRKYSFGQLIRAQALGDFQALDDAGRRAALVKIKGDPAAALARLAGGLKARAGART